MNQVGPFLKWAGSKRRLIGRLAGFCPERIERYFEPFLGSGALFFYLARTRPRFKAVLSDANPELINAYRCVKDHPDDLVEVLREHQNRYYAERRRYYYHVRDERRPAEAVERAAKTIFLNRTCYNGLFRVNSSGKFNVPHGTYARPNICNKDALFAASDILRRTDVEIIEDSYQNVTAGCRLGDFVYLDPPYLPLTKTARFVDYTRSSFGYDDHVALAREFDRLQQIGCTVVLSNSDSPRIRDMYSDFQVSTVGVHRLINCNAAKRSGHRELIITCNGGLVTEGMKNPARSRRI